MVLKSSSKKKLSIAFIVIFMALILTGVGIGVYFFVKDKSGEKGLTKNQIAFGTTIKNYDRMPSSSTMNFAGAYDGSVQNVIDFSSTFVAYEENSETYFVSLENKQPFVLGFEFDHIVSILDNLAFLKKGDQTIVYNLSNKTQVSSFKNASVSKTENFAFIKSNIGETFSALCGNETLNVTSVIVNTVSGNVVFKTTLDDQVIDVSFGKYFAVITDLAHTKAFSLSENFKEVLSLENRGEETSGDFNIKSSLSEKSFVMIELYRASELSSRALLIEKTSAAIESNYTISATFAGRDVFYSVEYNIFDSKTNSFALLETDGCLVEAAKCDFAEAYVAVVKTEILNKKSASGKRTIEYYYLKTNEISKNKLQTEKLVSFDHDKYGLIVGYDKGKLFTTGGSASSVISFKGEQTSCILSSAGEKAENTSADNSVVVFSSVSGLKGVKLASGDVLFNAEFDKISLISGKNMVAKKGSKYFVLDTEKGIVEISNFAAEFENYVFSGIGYYFTKASNGKYNVYKLDKTAYKTGVSVKFVETFDNLKMYVGDEIVSFSLPSGILNKNLEIAKSDIVFGFARNFAARRSALAEAETLEASEINVDKTTGAGFATYAKTLSSSDLDKLEFISYANLSNAQKALIPAFDNASEQSYTLAGATAEENVNFVFDGAYFMSDDSVMIAVIRLKNEQTNELSFMVNVALKNAYLKEAHFASDSDFVYFDEEGKHAAQISFNKSVAATTLTAKVGLYNETTFALDRSVNYAAAGFDGGMVFVSNDASSLDYKVVVSNVFVSDNEESDLYEFESLTDGQILDQGNYVLTVIKTETEKKIQVSAKEGYAFKALTAVVTNNSSIVGNSEKTVVSTLSEYAVSFTIDFSSFSETHFKLENISMVEWFARLTLKDFEGSEQADKTAYYFYGYQDNVSSERNPAPFGFENFKRKTNVSVYAREGYDFNGFDFEKDGVITRAIDSTGNFVASSMLLVSDLKATDIVLNANYSAKTYHIKYKNGGTILLEDKSVLFDSEIGELLTAAEIDVPAGYNFMGWTYNGNLITSGTKYTFARDIIVEAKYEAKNYVLKFDANADTYFGVNIKGFDYNVNNVLFASDFAGHYAGDKFAGEISKTITFGQEFGALPVLSAFYTVSGENQETYIFVGWFAEKEFALSGETITRGLQYSENSVVENDPPIETLYAHYEKSVYRVDLVDANQDLVENDGAKVPHFDKLRYEGSTKAGTKNSFSTASETGYELLTKTNDTYNLYTVSDAPLNLQMFVNNGYYISKITVEIYNGSDVETFIFTGAMNGENYSISGSGTSNLIVSATGKDVSVNFAKILTSKLQSGENLGAKIVVETSAIYFENTFILTGTGTGVQRGNAFNISENGTDSGLIYNSENAYVISLLSKTSGVGTLNLSVMKKLTINGTTLEFVKEYKEDNGEYYNVVSVSNFMAESSEVVNGVIQTTYKIGNATFVSKYNISSKIYTYELSVLQLQNNQIEIETENVSSKVQMNYTNISEDQNKQQGMSASLKSNIGGTANSVSNVDSGYNVSGILPTDKLEFSLNLNNHFIMAETALVLNYGNGSYTIYRFSISNINTKTATISQSHSFVGQSMFSQSSNVISMNGTNITLSYNSQTKTFTIGVAGIYEDVSVSLQYLAYRFVTIYSDSDKSYSATVQNGTFDQKTLDEIAETNASDVQKITESGTISYVIFKNESNISNIKVEAKRTDSELYKITSYSGKVTLSEGDTVALVKIGETSYLTFLIIKKIERLINLANYLGQNKTDGKFDYAKDPLTGLSLLANMTVSYYNSLGNEISYTFDQTNKNVYFNGTKIIITFADIKNYTLQSAGLYNVDTGELLTDGLVETNVNGTYIYTYSLSSAAGDKFEFRTYFDPHTFAVRYDLEGNVNGVASSSVQNEQTELAKFENQVAYWNAPYQVVDVTLVRTGYNFLGYSLEVSDQSTYAPGDTLTNFEISEDQMENEKEVTLHAVYSAKTFKINYVTRDATSSDYTFGSTGVVLTGKAQDVTFDQKLVLRSAYRRGYNFSGWYIGILGTKNDNTVTGQVVTEETVLDDELFNSLSFSDGVINLYAGWEAIRFTINFNKNDNSVSNGSTAASGDIASISVLFDNEEIPELPTLTRYGYTFEGFKAQQLLADVSNEYDFVKAGNVLDYNYMRACGISIPNSATPVSEFTVYAIWSAKTFRAIIDTQKLSLNGQGDGDPDITLSVNDGYTGIENDNYYIDIKFDSMFGIVPSISATGYQYNGVFTEPTGGTEIIASTVVDSSFNEEFIIYAQYTILSYNINIDSGNRATSDPESSVTKEFYDSLSISFTTKTGYYIQTITIFNDNETVTLTYYWDSETKTMVLQKVTSSKDSTLSSLDKRTSIYRNLTVQYQYNEQSGENIDARSCSLVLTINKIKSDFNVKIQNANVQTYALSFFTFAEGSNGQETYKQKYKVLNFDISNGGYRFCQEVLLEDIRNYPYLPGYKFVEYRYGTLENGIVVPDMTDNGIIPVSDTNYEVLENRKIVAVYTDQTRQGVHFYFYVDGTYVERSENEYMMYWKEGSEWNGNSSKFDINPFVNGTDMNVLGGKILELPSIGSFLWPDGNVLCGFVIATSAPSSGYYNLENSKALKQFDGSTKIEEEYNVYAVYDEQYFTVSNNGTTLKSDYSLYQEYNGTYLKVSGNIKYFSMDEDNYTRYLEYIANGQTAEVSLAMVAASEVQNCALNGYYVAVIMSDSNTFYKVSDNVLKIG